MDKIKGWETKMMRRLSRFRRKDNDRVLHKDGEEWQGPIGRRRNYRSLPKLSQTLCGELWDGSVTKGLMLLKLLGTFSRGEVHVGGRTRHPLEHDGRPQ